MVKSREVGAGENLAVHEVEEGWSLSDLALTYYHDASKWKNIAAANALGLKRSTLRYKLEKYGLVSAALSD